MKELQSARVTVESVTQSRKLEKQRAVVKEVKGIQHVVQEHMAKLNNPTNLGNDATGICLLLFWLVLTFDTRSRSDGVCCGYGQRLPENCRILQQSQSPKRPTNRKHFGNKSVVCFSFCKRQRCFSENIKHRCEAETVGGR